MRYFKLPLIVTATVLPLALVTGVVMMYWILDLEIPHQEKAARAEQVGSGLAKLVCLIIAPFWLISAFRYGMHKRVIANKS
jgi:hypothetical protein